MIIEMDIKKTDDGNSYQIAKTLLEGMYDDACILSLFRGHPHLIETIWTLATNESRWKRCIKFPTFNTFYFTEVHGGVNSDSQQGCVEFPPPTDININMMPFIMGMAFDESRLPTYLENYWPMIELCLSADLYRKDDHSFKTSANEIGKIGYLTIEERLIEAGKSQRRAGLHTDNPGKILVNSNVLYDGKEGSGCCEKYIESSKKYFRHHWGYGACHSITFPVSTMNKFNEGPEIA